MKNFNINLFKFLLIVVSMLYFLPGGALADDQVIITGTVNEFLQIVTDDGQVFEIEDSPKAYELIDHIDSQVEVAGTLSEEDGISFISVIDFKVITRDT